MCDVDELEDLLEYFNINREMCGLNKEIIDNPHWFGDDWERNILCVLAGFKAVALIDYDFDFGKPGTLTKNEHYYILRPRAFKDDYDVHMRNRVRQLVHQCGLRIIDIILNHEGGEAVIR